jgi:patatin-like phospholipase/acyl hydrolase
MAYKILSLDGGGSWAMIQTRVLMDIYGDICGHELLKKFDMVIANSGGSLVLAALCQDMKLSEVTNVFMDKSLRKKVFSALSFWERFKLKNIASLTNILGPKYSTKRKLSGLTEVLKNSDHLYQSGQLSKPIIETPLHELPAIIKKDSLQLLIVGFDYYRERASFFRSNPISKTDKYSKYYQVTLAHAIHASSNAPVNYFDEPALVNSKLLNGEDSRNTLYWDGAVSGFNNPVLAGLIEAKTNVNLPPEEYCILSLGTGTGGRANIADYASSTDANLKDIYNKNKDNKLAYTKTTSNFFQDVKKMSTSILGDPPDSASFIAYCILDPLLTNNANIIRINPCIKPELNSDKIYQAPAVYRSEPNGLEKFLKLIDMDMDAVEDDEAALISQLCDKFIITEGAPCLPNQLIRGDIKADHLGQGTFFAAKQRWLACK